VRRLRAYAASFTGFERDARRFLLVTIVFGAALSLYWIDFNLYLAAIGIPRPEIGLIATGGSLAGALVAFPASALSNRLGRRVVIVASIVVMALMMVALLFVTSAPLIAPLVAAFAAGQQSVFVLTNPFLTEHSRPEHRSELFSLQFALMSFTQFVAALGGGLLAGAIAQAAGFDPGGPDAYRLVLVAMTVLFCAAAVVAATLRDDRPGARQAGRAVPREADAGPASRAAATPATARSEVRHDGAGLGDRARFVRLVLPGFLIAIGAGQIIPFLNLFVQRKFGLELASLNGVFALTSLGTMAAILLQPALARRLGRVRSVVAVQGASIPFLVVLGFSPVLWTVVIALAVRNSLMNAGNPILNAFAMDQVPADQRARLSATIAALWSTGWVIGGPYYSLLQSTLGFEGGYTVNFITIIVLYSTATTLYWRWFRDAEPRPVRPERGPEPVTSP
jgi:MFS family permease